MKPAFPRRGPTASCWSSNCVWDLIFLRHFEKFAKIIADLYIKEKTYLTNRNRWDIYYLKQISVSSCHTELWTLFNIQWSIPHLSKKGLSFNRWDIINALDSLEALEIPFQTDLKVSQVDKDLACSLCDFIQSCSWGLEGGNHYLLASLVILGHLQRWPHCPLVTARNETLARYAFHLFKLKIYTRGFQRTWEAIGQVLACLVMLISTALTEMLFRQWDGLWWKYKPTSPVAQRRGCGAKASGHRRRQSLV